MLDWHTVGRKAAADDARGGRRAIAVQRPGPQLETVIGRAGTPGHGGRDTAVAVSPEERGERGPKFLGAAKLLSGLSPRRKTPPGGLAPAGPGTGSMRKKAPNVERTIRKMVERIVREFDPERIILFGSHARGEGGPDSDVDLLVVMPVEGPKHKKQVEIRVALRDIRVPKDIIVTTPEEFAWRKDVVGTIEYPAVREGRVVYARS